MDTSLYPLVFNFRTVQEDNKIDYFQNYLRYNALMDNQEGVAKTHLLIDTVNQKDIILGFYTIRSSSLIKGQTENNERLGEPALEIMELAVSKDYQHKGIGTILMKDIIAKAYKLNSDILGIKHIVVCSKNSAISFYKNFGFDIIPYSIPRNIDNQDCIAMSVCLQFK